EAIAVRIGLHMGQVAVENSIQLDMFGRHVNRASRVEGLADGGQIYMTYPVVDSAKSWLGEKINRKLTWKMHGRYFLKGIPAPVEIYEVVDADRGQPRRPAKGKKKSALPPVWAGVVLLLLGVSIPLVVLQVKKTTVYFVKFYADEMILDQKEKIILDGDKSLEARRVLNKISPGKHILHYDIHSMSKYYMEFDVKRGKNYIHPRFKENRLPEIERRITLDDKETHAEGNKEGDFTYLLYDNKNQKRECLARLEISVSGNKAKPHSAEVEFTFNWKLFLNGREAAAKQMTVVNRLANEESIKKAFEIYEDEQQYYQARFFIHRATAEIALAGAYIEYKK
ncbi:adenylate/guanylate cyclase domain-containing protein, partial [candidate division FCPU426 bacterium]|nr:adenylate/guanylate cyclase domain-containing protein [candidate division FCPU426 bacterium]